MCHMEFPPGVLFAEYESGPWLALKSKTLSGTALRWVGLGEASLVFPGAPILKKSICILLFEGFQILTKKKSILRCLATHLLVC